MYNERQESKTLRIKLKGSKFSKAQLSKLINDVNIEILKNKVIK